MCYISFTGFSVFCFCFFRYFSFQVLSSSFFNLNLVNPVLLCLISLVCCDLSSSDKLFSLAALGTLFLESWGWLMEKLQ